jgi:hypothetical protein
MALARRRVNVLWAMMRDGTTFETRLRLDIFIEILHLVLMVDRLWTHRSRLHLEEPSSDAAFRVPPVPPLSTNDRSLSALRTIERCVEGG